jgi:hypothetical protein
MKSAKKRKLKKERDSLTFRGQAVVIFSHFCSVDLIPIAPRPFDLHRFSSIGFASLPVDLSRIVICHGGDAIRIAKDGLAFPRWGAGVGVLQGPVGLSVRV